MVDLIQDGKNRFRLRIFKEILIIACWCIWLHRNKVIFHQGVASLLAWCIEFREAFALVIYQVKPSLWEVFVNWLRDFS